MNNLLEISIIDKTFNSLNNNDLKVIKNLNFTVNEGEFISIIGQSGCGKSTILKILLGLDENFEGQRVLNKQVLKGLNPKISMVFQELRLIPWLNVKDNILFAIPNHQPQNEVNIKDVLELVGLSEYASAWIKELSGGMKQRVALARAFINLPQILLLDEPFKGLDAFLRDSLQKTLKSILTEKKTTTILVTHDIDEAIFLSDKIIVLSKKPSSIKKIINVNQKEMEKNNNNFLQLRKVLYNELFSE